MKIIIVGAGRVGASLAENLVSEHNDITLIDPDPAILADLQDRYDLQTIQGNGAYPNVLKQAGAEDADMLVAVTRSDEINLVACRIAAQMFNVPRRIARVRAPELVEQARLHGDEGFNVDHVICPEQSVTDHIERLIEYPGALQVLEFANGRVTLVSVRAYAGGPLVGQAIEQLKTELPKVDVRVVALIRDNQHVPVDGYTTIQPGDEVFCLCDTRQVRVAMAQFRRQSKPVSKVMIAGGGNIGLRLARALQDDYQVKIIESDPARCERLATQLNSRALVLLGDATDEDLLADENVQDADLFIALTSDDENNIMSSLLAKKMGASRVITLIQRKVYAELVQGGQIDIAMAPSNATLSELLKHIRRGDVVAVHRLRRGVAEAIETIAHGDAKSSKVVGRAIEHIAMPKGAVIGAIVRGEQVIMAHHDTVIEADDHVITFVEHRKLVPAVEKLFQVGVGFF
ncbi:MAG TPA: Trk system potassium transporter TrkA [Limnobacter sp.]|uniref:Trk system potassium transporter TrkA n=1 Tax=Limnobacter sp. TaxID=2003368 RepID=UPI002ED78560